MAARPSEGGRESPVRSENRDTIMNATFPFFFYVIMAVILGCAGGILVAVSDLDRQPVLLLAGILLLIGMAAAVGRIIIELFSAGAGTLLVSGKRKREPPPVYSVPRAKRLQGDFDGALHLYREITRSHPQEIRAWLAMLEIVLEDLRDGRQAEALLEEGLSVLEGEKKRTLFQRTYDEGTELLRKYGA